MPDITMCYGDKCPVKETCYRFVAYPSQRHQSYFMKSPFTMEEEKFDCTEYWEANVFEKEPKLSPRPKK